MKIWECKIGECEERDLLKDGKYYGADSPMRQAICKAYIEVTGKEPEFIFSGWGAELTEIERDIVDGATMQPKNTDETIRISGGTK